MSTPVTHDTLDTGRSGPDPRVRLEAVARARHDLGKYVAFQTRCLDPGASIDELRSALDVDLNATRSTPRAGCVDLWRGLRTEFVATGVDAAQIAAIDADIAALAAGAACLHALDRDALVALGAAAVGLGETLRGLHRQLLAAAAGEAPSSPGRSP